MKFLKNTKVNLGPKWDLYQASLSELVIRQTQFKVNHQRQRKYLYKDTKGGVGHIWQRKIFVSLLMGTPIPQFEIHIDKKNNIVWIEDGQQRYYTFYAIINDNIKLPYDLSEYGSEYVKYEGMCWSELPESVHTNIYNQQMLLLNGKELTKELLHKRFILINNGTPLTQQDKRSAQISNGADYIQGIVDGSPTENGKLNELSPTKKMFTLLDGEYTNVGVTVRGRELEQIVAHWYNSLQMGDKFQIDQTQLNQLYKNFRDTSEITHEKYFSQLLSKVDKCVCSYSKNPKELKGRKLLLFFFVVKHYHDNGFKINAKELIDDYMTSLSFLKKFKPKDEQGIELKEYLITYTKKDGKSQETLDWNRLIRLSSDMAQISAINNIVLEKIKTYHVPITIDSRRVFSREEKLVKLEEQGDCCGYCGVDLVIDDSYGDHKIPHSHGGETIMDNLVTSCKSCNDMKSSLPYDLWKVLIPELKNTNKKLINVEDN